MGNGLLVYTRFVGTPRVGLTNSPYGRDFRAGYGQRVVESGEPDRLHVRRHPRTGGAFPITVLQKASSKRHTIPGCKTIRIPKPSCFVDRGEGVAGGGELHYTTNI